MQERVVVNRLSDLELEGFKSIRKLQLALRPINVFIGANGSGKSNLLSFFKMLNYMMTEGLDIFVGKAGGANALLYYGSKTTPEMSFRLGFETDRGWNEYFARLVSAAGDTLIFADERIKYVPKEKPDRPPVSLGAGHRNTLLAQEDRLDRKVVRTAKTIRSLMSTWRFYQFHDTSENSNMRKHASVHENRWLMHDGGNLASLLYWMRETHPAYYRRIVLTIRRVAPFFDDFTLEPSRWNENKIILEWKEIGSESVFTVHQLSDGTLRFMALATLLLQPYPPALMVIDEPELGLHPHAISVLAELIKAAGETSQILVSTQSVTLVNEFEPEDVIVVERSQGESLFRRLNGDELVNWLEEYSLDKKVKKLESSLSDSIRASFEGEIEPYDSPEHINEHPESAPSKRIIRALPRYAKQKTTAGSSVAEAIGLDTMKRRCPHFSQWIDRLRALKERGAGV